jgi:hypothetical protein
MKRGGVFLLGCCLIIPSAAWSADSFDYAAFPPGFYMADYPAYYSAHEVTDKDGHTLIANLGLRSYINVVKFALYGKDPFFKRPLQVTAVLPSGRVEMLNEHAVGFGDLTVVAGYWPIVKESLGIGTGPGCYVDMPTGKYSATRLANIGNNYWRVRPTWVFSRFVFPYDIETALTYNIYFQNPATKVRNGNEIVFESYFGRFVSPRFMLGGHFNYITGFDKELNGARLPDTRVRQFQAGPSVTFLTSQFSNVMVKVLTDFGSRNTAKGILWFLRVGWKVL